MLHHHHGQLAPLSCRHELVEDDIYTACRHRPTAATRHHQRLFATNENAIGKVVFAIFKIEDGTLTLAEYDMSDEPPKTFASVTSRYVVKKVQPQKKNAEPPKTK